MWPSRLLAGDAREYFKRERRAAGVAKGSEHAKTRAPADPGLNETIDRLLARKAWMAGLPPVLMARYRERTSGGRRNLLISLLLWIAALNFFCTAFDLWTVPEQLIATVILCRLAISATMIAAALSLKAHASSSAEGILLIVPCMIMIIVAGFFGLAANSLLLERYVINAVLVIATAIVLAPVQIKQTIILAVLAIIVLTGFVFASPDFALAAKLQIIAFHASGLFALFVARQAQNRIQYRFFLMTLRNEIQVKQLADMNERLTDLSLTDALTGVANRRHFEDRLTKLAAGDAGCPSEMAVLMIDIDHFKHLNDRLGHGQGDRCLRMVAETIRQSVRVPDDLVARYGGEEFIALLAASAPDAMKIAERIRRSVAKLALANPAAPGGIVTVSVGVAIRATPATSLNDVVCLADDALYVAKRCGRNRVQVYDGLVAAAAS